MKKLAFVIFFIIVRLNIIYFVMFWVTWRKTLFFKAVLQEQKQIQILSRILDKEIFFCYLTS